MTDSHKNSPIATTLMDIELPTTMSTLGSSDSAIAQNRIRNAKRKSSHFQNKKSNRNKTKNRNKIKNSTSGSNKNKVSILTNFCNLLVHE